MVWGRQDLNLRLTAFSGSIIGHSPHTSSYLEAVALAELSYTPSCKNYIEYQF